MRVAILYTGEFRTCEKTIHYTKQNILLNEDVHVFATIQHSETEYCENFLKSHMGIHLKELKFFNKINKEWNLIQDELLNKMSIHPHINKYLKTSGSMIEYYQSYLSYQELLKYEKLNNIKYDYIVRLRTDIIYTQPLTFNFLKMTVNDIIDNFKLIHNITQESMILSHKNIAIFFNNLLCETNKELRIKSEFINNDIRNNSEDCNKMMTSILNADENDISVWEKIRQYINNGKYMISLRNNVFYIIKREYFSDIQTLGITYGSYIDYNNRGYWWNSESQLQEICKHYQISKFDSTILLEGKSLYEYKASNYFNDNNMLIENLNCLFFICRHK
jgi:hypothetical protein